MSYPLFRIMDKGIAIRKLGFTGKSLLLSLVLIILVLTSSFVDKTLVLENENIGLIEHPTVWLFFIIQIIIPYSIFKALDKFFKFLEKNDIIKSNTFLLTFGEYLLKFVNRKTLLSNSIYLTFCAVGFVFFVWNSFQNQEPMRFLGFDFWDSARHPFGYAITRILKFYQWVLFFPTIFHLYISLLLTVNRLLKEALKNNNLSISPYNKDGKGGADALISMCINPFIPIIIFSALAVLSVFIIHDKILITPIIGLFLLNVLFLFSYILPAYHLHYIIKKEKEKQLNEISIAQNSIFYVLNKKTSPSELFKSLDTLNAFEPVVAQIKSIPNWPCLVKIYKVVSLVNLPVAITIVKKAWPVLDTLVR